MDLPTIPQSDCSRSKSLLRPMICPFFEKNSLYFPREQEICGRDKFVADRTRRSASLPGGGGLGRGPLLDGRDPLQPTV